ncbi:MAG TPA: UDP-2,3-diacylglucosamine diphosphatase [Longimicrobiales bacterium]|nr:UDP-2,3-diacylglucosamine diphosphatase [Longimicrobiales bacterium]
MSSSLVHLTSDVHLGAIPPENERAFLAWLEDAGAEADTVVLNGDLFDYWFEYRTAIPQGYTRALGVLAAVVDAGVTVHLMGGNHDWWGGRFLEEEIGLRFHRDPIDLELAGHLVHLAHGDGLGPGDRKYKLLRAVLRSGPFRWAYRWLHPDLGSRVANRASSTVERKAEAERTGGPHQAQRVRSRVLESWAAEMLEARPEVDLVVLGHTHIPMLTEPYPGRYYLNCGDWVNHRTFAVLERGTSPLLLSWQADGHHVPFTP